tara:strand:- start:481 stop:864 length:384 start_codon:yes stop_codon:yes gene_type:complete
MRRTVVSKLSELDAKSVENSVGPGTPDVNFIGGWIELKWARAWPKRETTPLRLDHFTIQQRRWLSQRRKKGGRAFVLLKVAREWFLFDGEIAAESLGQSTRTELYDLAIKAWPTRMAWTQLVEAITE